jgi:CheY-like chemotaxis protein
MHPGPISFLIVDDNSDGRFLLEKTLLRCFPRAGVQCCIDIDAAVAFVKKLHPAVIVVHRAGGLDGLETIRRIRDVSIAPIVYVSGYDRTEEAKKAGANCYLNYDAWLRIGTVVADLLPNHIAPEEGTVPLSNQSTASMAPFANGKATA